MSGKQNVWEVSAPYFSPIHSWEMVPETILSIQSNVTGKNYLKLQIAYIIVLFHFQIQNTDLIIAHEEIISLI